MKVTSLFLKVVLAVVALSVGQQQALADKYPTKPVKIIVPLSPGGASDTNARIVAAELSKRLGQQFIVDNRTGAGGSIGTAIAAKAKPDGYTILWVSNTNMVVSSQLYKVKYNTLRDFVPLALVTRANNVLYVNNSVPVKSAKELIALAKKKPGKLFYSSSGNGTTVHMSFELFKTATGIDITHVPHKGWQRFGIERSQWSSANSNSRCYPCCQARTGRQGTPACRHGRHTLTVIAQYTDLEGAWY